MDRVGGKVVIAVEFTSTMGGGWAPDSGLWICSISTTQSSREETVNQQKTPNIEQQTTSSQQQRTNRTKGKKQTSEERKKEGIKGRKRENKEERRESILERGHHISDSSSDHVLLEHLMRSSPSSHHHAAFSSTSTHLHRGTLLRRNAYLPSMHRRRFVLQGDTKQRKQNKTKHHIFLIRSSSHRHAAIFINVFIRTSSTSDSNLNTGDTSIAYVLIIISSCGCFINIIFIEDRPLQCIHPYKHTYNAAASLLKAKQNETKQLPHLIRIWTLVMLDHHLIVRRLSSSTSSFTIFSIGMHTSIHASPPLHP
jgi:hypothetical protein